MQTTKQYSATKDDLKQLVQTIENLAHDVHAQLNRGDDYILTANELVAKTSTLVFAMGEVHALEQSGMNKVQTAVQSIAARKTSFNFHNVRDSRGRFARR